MRVMAFALLGAFAVAARADTGAGDLTPEVRALVDQWLAAQNGGDFAAYEKLYAKKFTGVRRSGARAVSLDRAGWMRDRQRMFAKPMKVVAADLRVAAAASSARVLFTQDWESGRYHDRGLKQLVVVRQDGAARIGREEMLASEKAPTGAQMADAARLAFVIAGYAVVADAAEEKWGTGAPQLDADDFPMVSSRRASASLPPELEHWVGRKLALYGASGVYCTATVREVRVLSVVIPPFDTRSNWNEDHTPVRERAADVWKLGAQMVGAKLDGCDLKAAQFARAAELPAATVVAGVAVKSSPLRAAALKALRALPSWRALQKSWTGEYKHEGRWDVESGDSGVVVERWALPQPLVTVGAHNSEGCGGFGGEVFAVFELGGSDEAPTLKLRAEPATTLRPAAAVMLDGVPGFVGTQGWESIGTERLWVPLTGEVRKLEEPFLGCPC
jgi:ketosteroid isomerase-like protein